MISDAKLCIWIFQSFWSFITSTNDELTSLRAFTIMKNGGSGDLIFAKMVVLATLSTLRLVFIITKFYMTAAAILTFGQTTFLVTQCTVFPGSILYICCIILVQCVHPRRNYSHFFQIRDCGHHLDDWLDRIFRSRDLILWVILYQYTKCEPNSSIIGDIMASFPKSKMAGAAILFCKNDGYGHVFYNGAYLLG